LSATKVAPPAEVLHVEHTAEGTQLPVGDAIEAADTALATAQLAGRLTSCDRLSSCGDVSDAVEDVWTPLVQAIGMFARLLEMAGEVHLV
jgi:hypothetical protein